jgi:D-serine deaminase-like pyridoxal phosphate-dependent protein
MGPNQHLVGEENSRQKLMTPALVIDIEAAEQNIATMATWAADGQLRLRPHAKSHKSPDIAKRQIAAGAVGQCCASILEAEVLAAAGIPGLLITTAMAPNKAGRLAALRAGGADVTAVVDSVPLFNAYAAAAEAAGTVLPIMIDLDVGLGRTGTSDPNEAVEIARLASAHDSTEYTGVQGYMGHLQHIQMIEDRRSQLVPPTDALAAHVQALREANLAPGVVTGGGTGTHRLDAEKAVLGEIQAGSYVFMDVDYNVVDQTPDGTPIFASALFVQCSVVNVNHPEYAVTDAGLKSFATDGPLPEIARGAPDGSSYRYKGDEHGAIFYPDGVRNALDLGAKAECVVPHCDPNVNLFDHYHVVRGETLVDIWPVAARGNP